MLSFLDPIAQYIIYIHATLGAIALLTGSLAMIFKKGSKQHKASGLIFYRSLGLGATLAILISLIPSHYSPFMFAIGIFTLYLILSGYKALRFKKKVESLLYDKIVSISMLITSVGMILIPLLTNGSFNIVLTVFGGIGLFSAIRDFRLYKNPEQLKKLWLRLHLGNMMGAYIASFTAFLVINQFLAELISWLGPTLIGTAYIIFWNRKIAGSKKTKAA